MVEVLAEEKMKTVTVWKYAVELTDEFSIWMPVGAKPLSVQLQDGEPQLWALVDANEERKEYRRFRLAGTGHLVTEEYPIYVGTFQMDGGRLVWHLFAEESEVGDDD